METTKIRMLRPAQGKSKYRWEGRDYILPELVANKYIMAGYAVQVR